MSRRPIGHRPRQKARAEEARTGGLLRQAREDAGLTQVGLARRLRRTQQAVAQAERAEANPTVEFLLRWAKACKRRLSIRID